MYVAQFYRTDLTQLRVILGRSTVPLRPVGHCLLPILQPMLDLFHIGYDGVRTIREGTNRAWAIFGSSGNPHPYTYSISVRCLIRMRVEARKGTCTLRSGTKTACTGSGFFLGMVLSSAWLGAQMMKRPIGYLFDSAGRWKKFFNWLPNGSSTERPACSCFCNSGTRERRHIGGVKSGESNLWTFLRCGSAGYA